MPRGRSYIRNGSVVDLQIAKGEVSAFVSGSQLYEIKIGIAPVDARRWKSICRDCAGGIDSLVELLQGRLAKAVMDRVCRDGDGLFPSPQEITLSCSCPDWADMCKHVAAALYGVGARLDEQPQLVFLLRGVDENELVVSAGEDVSLVKAAPAAAQVLDESDIASLFGLEMAEPAASERLVAASPRQPDQPAKKGTARVAAPPMKHGSVARSARTKSGTKQAAKSGTKRKAGRRTPPQRRRRAKRPARGALKAGDRGG